MKTKKNINRRKSLKRKVNKHYPYIWTNETKKKSLLGGGFFGEIYLMTNCLDNREYAVKCMNIDKIQKFSDLCSSIYCDCSNGMLFFLPCLEI